MDIKIVPFRPEDIDAVYRLQRAAYKPLYDRYRDDETSPFLESRETVLRKYARSGTRGYLILSGGAPVGAVRVVLDPEGGGARLSALCVDPGLQGRGIAQAALAEIERLHGDIRRWRLDTILEEKGNCHLYEKLGYVRTGRTEAVNARMTLVYYEKHMKGMET